jgi:hypothetical protein
MSIHPAGIGAGTRKADIRHPKALGRGRMLAGSREGKTATRNALRWHSGDASGRLSRRRVMVAFSRTVPFVTIKSKVGVNFWLWYWLTLVGLHAKTQWCRILAVAIAIFGKPQRSSCMSLPKGSGSEPALQLA